MINANWTPKWGLNLFPSYTQRDEVLKWIDRFVGEIKEKAR
jgi:hypothetical protein